MLTVGVMIATGLLGTTFSDAWIPTPLTDTNPLCRVPDSAPGFSLRLVPVLVPRPWYLYVPPSLLVINELGLMSVAQSTSLLAASFCTTASSGSLPAPSSASSASPTSPSSSSRPSSPPRTCARRMLAGALSRSKSRRFMATFDFAYGRVE
jgi:hypothetical protein